MKDFFERHIVRFVVIDQYTDLSAYLKDFAVCVALLGADRTTGNACLCVDYAITGSGDPRVYADKLQPASEDIFSITSSGMSKFA